MLEAEKVSKDKCEERHEAIKQYLGNDKGTLNVHTGEIKTIQEAIKVLAAIQARHDDDIRDHEGRLRVIEAKPGKKWDSVTAQILQIVVAAIAGGFIGKAIPF